MTREWISHDSHNVRKTHHSLTMSKAVFCWRKLSVLVGVHFCPDSSDHGICTLFYVLKDQVYKLRIMIQQGNLLYGIIKRPVTNAAGLKLLLELVCIGQHGQHANSTCSHFSVIMSITISMHSTSWARIWLYFLRLTGLIHIDIWCHLAELTDL